MSASHQYKQKTEDASHADVLAEKIPVLTSNAKVIAVSSGKGGVGKSFLATNLAIAFAQAGNSVCLFDADTNMANINILLGITPLHTLEHFFTQDLALKDIIIQGSGGIDMIAGTSGVADFVHLSQPQQQKLVHGLQTLEKKYHYLLIDTAAGADETNINLILAAPYLILTITGEPTSLTDAFSLLRILKKYHFNRPVLVIVNMAEHRVSAQAIFKRFKNAVSQYLQLKSYLAGYVLADKNVALSILQQQPLLLYSSDSLASQCLRRICQRLINVFEQRQHITASFSHYFSDLILSDEETKAEDTIELALSRDTLAKDVPLDSLSVEYSGLLRAGYYARLLSQKSP
ncbi:MAG: P-loop NTPase [gamma proteobacterium symbiont of Taylorina sp.]|nr:P-loop NTPase [gamma proteobacterium symbiont of Taylorina sp.]